jgi:LysR family transcriptional regulator of beta-lactamase
MDRPRLPLNALRAFEASARCLSFTQAAIDLCVTQAAVAHQVRALEQGLGVVLFRRLPRGLALTDEGLALLPVLSDAFDRIGATLDGFEDGRRREMLAVGAVGTFAVGWLIERLPAFAVAHPFVDLRLSTNNNRVDLAAEGLDYALRFGDGAWHGLEAERLFEAPLSPLCAPAVALRLGEPADLLGETLLRSYRADEWPRWFAAAGVPSRPLRGPVFDSSRLMAEAAEQGFGVALAPVAMFRRALAAERLVRPFAVEVGLGAYWLTRTMARRPTAAMQAFRDWLFAEVEADAVR